MSNTYCPICISPYGGTIGHSGYPKYCDEHGGKSVYGEQIIREILAEQRTALLTKLRDEVMMLKSESIRRKREAGLGSFTSEGDAGYSYAISEVLALIADVEKGGE